MSATPTTFKIERASTSDIPEIARIAELNRLNEGDSNDSFLVSNFTEAEYREFLSSGRKVDVLVARMGRNTIGGFLIGYNQDYAKRLPQGSSESVIQNAIGGAIDYNVVKQVAVDPALKGQGIARSLYEHFCDIAQSDLVFAAIVEKPVANEGSKAFHRAMGFAPYLQASPRNPHYSARIVNSIWLKFTGARVQLPSPQSEAPEHLELALDHVRALYQHEDNLNWTKMSSLITILFALLTALWFILQMPEGILGATTGLVLVALGLFSLMAVRAKVKSGLAYMSIYKATMRLLEFRLAIERTGFATPAWLVPKASETSQWLKRMPGFALLVWMAGSLTLIAQIVSRVLGTPILG